MCDQRSYKQAKVRAIGVFAEDGGGRRKRKRTRERKRKYGKKHLALIKQQAKAESAIEKSVN